jgi:hypothetical protein
MALSTLFPATLPNFGADCLRELFFVGIGNLPPF